MEITLSTESVNAIVAEIKSIDEKLVKAAGTASERRNAAEKALRTAETTVPEGSEEPIGGPFSLVDDLTAQLAELTDKLADAKNDAREAVDGYLKAQKDETSTEAAALKAQRDVLATKVTALATLLEMSVDVPKAPKGSASSNGSGRAKTSKGVWSYRRADSDSWTVPNDHQQSLSSIAFRVFDKAPTPAVREALEAAGVTSFTQSFEQAITVNGKTATIKFEVTPSTPSE